MPSRDIRLELDPQVSLAPQTVSGAVNGTGVDLQGCEAALVILNSGAASTTAATIKIQESDASGSGYTDVADTDLIGLTLNSGAVLQTVSTVVKVSYIGVKRYVRVITTAGNGALFSAEVVRGHLRHAGGVPV